MTEKRCFVDSAMNKTLIQYLKCVAWHLNGLYKMSLNVQVNLKI